MAHLMGQLDFPARPDIALPLLERAATLATIQVAQPAYVYGLLLLGEFSQATIPPHLFTSILPPGASPELEARKHLERAAYLNFSPAQHRLGYAYEFGKPPFPFDALLSVQYYSLASQQGETEADMALSKWFLCGAEGVFDKDESLAYIFAEKAAQKGLPSAEFALGYYAEVGVGRPKNADVARRWYQRVTFIMHPNWPLVKQLHFYFNQAIQHGNQDARDRFAAPSQSAPKSFSQQQREALIEARLAQNLVQAKQRSGASGQRPTGRPDGQKIIENIRKGSLMMPAMLENVRPLPIPYMFSMQQRQPQKPLYQQPTPQQPTPQQPPPQQQPPQQRHHKPQEQQSPVPSPQPVSQAPPTVRQDGRSSPAPIDTAMTSVSESGMLSVPPSASCMEH
jgi:TPR repeat protein